MSKVDELEKAISSLKDIMLMSEVGNPFYFTDGSRKRDKAELALLERELEKAKEQLKPK